MIHWQFYYALTSLSMGSNVSRWYLTEFPKEEHTMKYLFHSSLNTLQGHNTRIMNSLTWTRTVLNAMYINFHTHHYKKQLDLIMRISSCDSQTLCPRSVGHHVRPQLGIEHDPQGAGHTGHKSRAAAARRIVQPQHATAALAPRSRLPCKQATWDL